MAQLLFFDRDHRYELDGNELPSVSQILRFLSREIYGNINQWTLDHAGGRGTRVHKACELIDKYGEVECDDDVAAYVLGYVQFLQDYSPAWTLIEKPLYSVEHGFAGTLDRAGTIRGRNYIVDIKAQESIKKPYVAAQLNGYDILRGVEPDGALACLQLTKSGKYRFHEVERDPSLFMSCLSIHRALEPKRRRKASNE